MRLLSVLVTSFGLCVAAHDDAAGCARAELVSGGPPYVAVAGHREFSGRMLVRPLQPAPGFSPDPAEDDLARAILEPYVVDYIADLDIYVVALPAGCTEAGYGQELLSTGLYDWVRPDWVLFPQAGPDDPLYPQQWHLPKVNAPGAWRFTRGIPSIVLAVVDTGVDLTHPDLATVLVPGYNSHWTSRKSQVNGGKVNDDNGHGTGVAGAAIAVGNNAYGGCGVAWNLRIMPIRATNPGSASGGANSSDIINGANWAANNGAKVVNCSWSGVSEPYVESLGASLRAKGALLVWPMDTQGTPRTFDHPNVVVVNGTEQSDGLYPNADWGPGVDLAAPAKDLLIPIRGGGYAVRSGTSYCSPIVGAAAGLVWSIAPTLTPAQVEQILFWSATDIGAPGQDDFFGYGRVDPYSAVVNLIIGNTGHPPPPHELSQVTAQDLLYAINHWSVDR